MSGGFTKLFNSIIGSTIWQENPATKVVWITMLTMRDKGGVVEASVPGLAKLSGVSIEEAEVALTKFLAPDPYSSSPEHEGRRIERVEGGWRILNHYKYQEKMSKDDIRERDRIRQQQYREQKKCRAKGVTKCDNRDTSRQSRHKDLDVPQPLNVENPNPLAHSENERGVVDPSNGSLIDTSKSKKVTTANRSILVADLYNRYPRKVGKADAYKAISKAIVTVAKRGATDAHSDFAGDEQAAAQWLGRRVDLYTRSPQARQPDKSKIPYPATWFNAGRYDDDEAEWSYIGTRKSSPALTYEMLNENTAQDPSLGEMPSRRPAWVQAEGGPQ